MALLDRQYAGSEAWLERDLAAQAGTWQQLAILKRRALEEREMPATPEGLTRSERLLWYRQNQPEIELDNYRVSCSENYRQLQLLRGVRAVEETEEDRAERAMTRSEAKVWYRAGGIEAVQQEKEAATLAGTWQQFSLMTLGRREPRDPEQVPTRSERLHWFRSGGHMAVEARDQLCRDSSNWMQYKVTRDRQQFTDNLEDAVNTRWSQFKNKEELSDYLTMKRTESMEERESVRIMVRNKINKDTMTKTAYDLSRQPYAAEEVEEESRRKVEAGLSSEERILKLRGITEKMLSHQSDYAQSAKALAAAAYKEAAEEAKYSSSKKRVTTVVQG